jgi:O-antigen ligase
VSRTKPEAITEQWRRLVAENRAWVEWTIVLALAAAYLAIFALGFTRGLRIWLAIAVLTSVVVPAAGVALTAVVLIPPEPNLVNHLPLGLFLLIAAVIGQLVRTLVGGRSFSLSLAVVSLAAFGLITLSSLIWVLTLTPLAPRAVPDWAVLVSGILACLLVASDPTLARWAPPFVFGAGALMAAFGALNVVTPGLFEHGPLDWLIRQGALGRAMGSTHNPNILGIVAGMSFAYFAIRAVGTRDARARVVAVLIAIASVPALYFTFSRSAALGVGAAIVVGLILLGRRWALIVVLLVVASAVVLGPTFIASRLDTSSGRPGGNQEQQVTDAQANSDRLRVQAWKAGIRMAIAKPLTGVGFGRYPIVKSVYRGPAELNSTHSDYIRFFAETGVPGGTAFLLFVLGVAWSLKAARESDRAGLAAALVAFGIATQFNAQLYYLESSLPFWVAAGASIQLHASRDRSWSGLRPFRWSELSTSVRYWFAPWSSRDGRRPPLVRRHAHPMPASDWGTSLKSRSAASVDLTPIDYHARTRNHERNFPTSTDDKDDLP